MGALLTLTDMKMTASPTKNGLEKAAMSPSPYNELFNILEMIRDDVKSLHEEFSHLKVEITEIRGQVANVTQRLDTWDGIMADSMDQKVKIALLEQRIKMIENSQDKVDKNQQKAKSLHYQVWIAIITSIAAPIAFHFVLHAFVPK